MPEPRAEGRELNRDWPRCGVCGLRSPNHALSCSAVACGADLIKAERHRQIEQEGWTAAHDDGHANDLVLAAIAYSYEGIRTGHPMALAIWPWDEEWWKPTDRVRSLVKAGALIAAEIDRLQRATSHPAVHVADDDTPERPLRPEQSRRDAQR